MTMRRFYIVARSVALAAFLFPSRTYAADLLPVTGKYPLAERVPTGRAYEAMRWPTYPQPHRFDIYGNPLGDYVVALPEPLVVNNGCPKAIEPTYDVDGNLAGYAPFVACR